MKKYGFIYYWFDNAKSKEHGPDKIERHYIGCHWGTVEDSYICSSNWMRKAYKRRPDDFEKFILETNIPTREETFDIEFKYLQMIPNEELGKKYYNIRNHHYNHWSAENNVLSIREKISETLKENYVSGKIIIWNKGKTNPKQSAINALRTIPIPDHFIHNLHLSVKELMEKYQISQNTVYRWKRKLKNGEITNKTISIPLDFLDNIQLSGRKLAKLYGVSKTTIGKWKCYHGYHKERISIPLDFLDNIQLSGRNLAKLYGVSRSTIEKWKHKQVIG